METDKPLVDDSRHHAAKVERMMDDLIRQLRADVDKLDDRSGRVLFQASAEVLLGMKAAFQHFQRRTEPAMR